MNTSAPTSAPPQADAPKSPMALRILTIVVVITIIYFAKLILLPILVAGFIALFASPLVRTWGV